MSFNTGLLKALAEARRTQFRCAGEYPTRSRLVLAIYPAAFNSVEVKNHVGI